MTKSQNIVDVLRHASVFERIDMRGETLAEAAAEIERLAGELADAHDIIRADVASQEALRLRTALLEIVLQTNEDEAFDADDATQIACIALYMSVPEALIAAASCFTDEPLGQHDPLNPEDVPR